MRRSLSLVAWLFAALLAIALALPGYPQAARSLEDRVSALERKTLELEKRVATLEATLQRPAPKGAAVSPPATPQPPAPAQAAPRSVKSSDLYPRPKGESAPIDLQPPAQGPAQAVTPPPTPDTPPPSSSVVESRVDGEWQGWQGETIVKLMNGQIWQQTQPHYSYHYSYYAPVLVYYSGAGWKMQVQGESEPVGVVRLK